MPPGNVLRKKAISAKALKVLDRDIVIRNTAAPATSAQVAKPVLWAGSLFWECHGGEPCPWTVQAYHDPSHNTFASGSNIVRLARNGDQFLMTAVVVLALYDAGINEVDFTHTPSMWGGLQSSAIYVTSKVSGSTRPIAKAYSTLENITHSNPPQRVLSFTSYFEAWQNNEPLQLFADSGYSHPGDHPVKLWARLDRLHIIKL